MCANLLICYYRTVGFAQKCAFLIVRFVGVFAIPLPSSYFTRVRQKAEASNYTSPKHRFVYGLGCGEFKKY